MSSTIYEGVWVDHSRGTFLTGLMLTLKTRDAAALIGRCSCQALSCSYTLILIVLAFVSLLTSVAGASLWRLVKFVTHQLKARHADSHTKDAQRATQMIMLRNSSSPAVVLRDALRVAMAWRTLSLSLFIIIVLSSIFAPLLTAISIASSNIVQPDLPYGLVRSGTCGYWDIADRSEFISKAVLNEAIAGANYAHNCYEGDSELVSKGDSNSVLCSHTFVQPTLEYSLVEADCPFGLAVYGNSLCNGTAIMLNASSVDTRDDLGLNTPESDKLQFSHSTTCAPIDPTGYFRQDTLAFGPSSMPTTNILLIRRH
jgi:hypothetical protein